MTAKIEPVNAGLMARLLTLCFVKARGQKYLGNICLKIMVAFGFFVKVKPYACLAEAHAMQLVAEKTSIPVPKVHCAFIRKGCTYTVMSRIEGQMAAVGWTQRSEESKTRVLDQLGRFVEQLRSVAPPPEGVCVGSVGGGPFFDPRLPSKLIWGPFATARELHQALVAPLDIDVDYEKQLPGLQELAVFYRKSSNELVLTHGDLSSLNIMLRGDDVVGIVDWETAGWFPTYWEYSCAKYVNPLFNGFWEKEVDRFLDPKPYEWEMECIRRRYFGDF